VQFFVHLPRKRVWCSSHLSSTALRAILFWTLKEVRNFMTSSTFTLIILANIMV